ncbi:MAG: carboxymuconolactone decarboxylase family protein [Actinomycetota bacterium]
MSESLEPRPIDELEDEVRAWVELSGARLGGDPLNIIRVLSHQPALVEPFLRWSAALAASPALGVRRHELACLRVAWRYGSGYEWDNHAPVAREAGVSDAEMAALRTDAPDGFDADDAALVLFVDAIVDGAVSSSTRTDVVRRFGADAATELVWTVGQYAGLSLVANALEVDADV